MSLLLEALKKAEKAKEDAQRRARGESAETPPPAAPPPAAPETPAPAELRLEGDPAPAQEGSRITTRAELPDLSAPIEIVADELRAKTPPPRELRLEMSREAPRRPAAQPQPAAQGAERDAQKTAARKVFEAKFKEPNPKLPFFITLGVLGVFAVGVVVYFWWQLRPPYPLVNTNPPRSPSETQVAAAPERVAPAPVPGAPSAAIPGLPGAPAAAAPAAPASRPAAASQPAASATPAVPRPTTPRPPSVLPPEKPLLAPAPGPEVAVTRAAAQIHPRVDAGYAAYQSGDLAKARAEYEQALNDEPTNRDALLGMAAVETRSGRYGAAEAAYLRVLQADPRDSNAQAGLLALRSARLDPLAAESRVKSMLAQDPGAHALNFQLGNQLAQQGRWAEAQQEYFKAFAGDPENADFAYNLAVSLDHLRQPRLAREYYQRAVDLAEKRGASFDLARARARLAQLGN